MSELTLKFKDNIISQISLKDKKSFLIGRRKSNDLVIENLAVSGTHARIERLENGYVLSDLQSKNGTYVNKKPVTTCLLKNGDLIQIGMHTLVFTDKKSAPAKADKKK
ncbi:MAG: FHA domain-containing protein [Thermodesulfobacteriota bacterium]